MYHGIHDTISDNGNYDSIYSVSINNFREQLDWLISHNYKTISIHNAINNHDLKNQVVITFDDGDISNYLIALPLLHERNMSAEFFITTNNINKHGFVKSAHIKELEDAGMSVQSHTATHRYLSDLSSSEIYNELINSKSSLENILRSKVDILSLPGGRGSSQVINIARNLGFKAICTSHMGHNTDISNPFNLCRHTVYRKTNINEFNSIVTGKGFYQNKIIWRQRLLSFPKYILGNTRYDKLRGLIIR